MSDPESEPKVRKHPFLRSLWFLFRWAFYLCGTIWAYGAIYFDGPGQPPGNMPLALAWVVVTLTYLLFLRGPWRRGLVWSLCFAAVLVPWLLIQPSNDREWSPEWAQLGWTEIDGDVVTIHNFRNFDHALDGTVTEHWEDRTVHLSNLQGLDYFQDNFMENGLIAHPMLSFDFGPDGRVVVSIETRREPGEEFSTLGGLYKLYELTYLFGDERDFVRTRTNVREEPVYLYHADFNRERVETMFLETVKAQNALKDQPRFYNVITGNCTTSLRAQTPAEKRQRFDYRLLLNGKLDELLYEKKAIATGNLSFEELREKSLISPAALDAHNDPEFSTRIREAMPWTPAPTAKDPSEE